MLSKRIGRNVVTRVKRGTGFTPIEIFAHGTSFQPLKIQIQIFQSKKIYQKTQLSIMKKFGIDFDYFMFIIFSIFYPVPLRGIYPD